MYGGYFVSTFDVCFHEMLVLCLSVLLVSLLLLSRRALLHPAAFGTLSSHLLLCYTDTHTLTHTNTSTISWDKLGFCDFLQILPLIRENNLKALHRKRHEYKRTFLEGYKRKKIQQKSMQPGSWLLTWWLVTTSSCHTILVLVFAHLNCTLCWNSFITLQGMDTTVIYHRGLFWKRDNLLLKVLCFECLQQKWSQ